METSGEHHIRDRKEEHMETAIEEVTPEKTEKALKEFKPNAAFQSALAIMPKTFADVMKMGEVFAQSGIVPDALKGKAAGCTVAILHGLEIGLTPSQAVANIMIINGRPSVWGDAMLALVMGSGEIEWFEEDAPDVAAQQGFGRFKTKRKGWANPVERRFSVEEAKRAGLLTKDTYRNYLGRMLQMRARSWGLRDQYPDVLKGIVAREEVDDYQVVNPPPQMPTRASGPKNVQDAILASDEAQPENSGNAPETKPQEAERPSESLFGDAQEPGNAKGDDQRPITETMRKELFKARSHAKIPVEDAKSYLKDAFGIDDTSRLTMAQAREFEQWIRDNKR